MANLAQPVQAKIVFYINYLRMVIESLLKSDDYIKTRPPLISSDTPFR